VISKPLRSKLSTACSWAIFTAGSAQLALTLGRPLLSLLASLLCGVLLTFFLARIEGQTGAPKSIITTHLLSTGIYLIINTLFAFIAYTDLELLRILFFCLGGLVHLTPLALSKQFIRRTAHGS